MQTDANNGDSDIGVSVVIPTYKRSDLLRAAIASAFEQSLSPVEVIVCDNDPDGSAEAVCDEINRSGLIYSQASEIQGPSFARNAGAALARGDWLAFLDDDDRWLPEYLETVTQAASDADVHIVLCSTIRERAAGQQLGKQPKPNVTVDTLLSRGNTGIVGSNTFIRTDTFNGLGGFDVEMQASGDADLLARLLENEFEYAVVSEPLVIQRIDHGHRFSENGSIFVYRGRLRLAEKHRDNISSSSRRKLLGRAHVVGFYGRKNPVRKF